jgi:hypothetical protein
MKTCAQCHGKLGLGVRSRNLWNGLWWVHVLFCSPFDKARIAAQIVTPQAIGRYLDQCLDPSVTTMSVGSGS